jgi:hypothetical protein
VTESQGDRFRSHPSNSHKTLHDAVGAMTLYRHTQMGLLMIVGASLVAVVVLPLLLQSGSVFALIFGLVTALALLNFGSLTVIVEGRYIEARFGLGWIRKRIGFDEIESYREVRNPWYYGWGIRIIPRGWLYNVSGFDAVELALRNGRRFRIGTDEPEVLARALGQAMAGPGREPMRPWG